MEMSMGMMLEMNDDDDEESMACASLKMIKVLDLQQLLIGEVLFQHLSQHWICTRQDDDDDDDAYLPF
jgi:hypothetical protein